LNPKNELVSEKNLEENFNKISRLKSSILEDLNAFGIEELKGQESENLTGEPIEILVELAKKEHINPWDIDIVEVTDKFLAKIEEMDLTDLRISGRTLLYASILLRMKSNAFMDNDEDDCIDDFDDFDDELGFYDVDEYPVPDLPLRRNSKRPVTLEELITELQKAEKVEVRRKERNRNKKQFNSSKDSIEDVLGIAHEESISEINESVYKSVETSLKDRDCISFSEFLETSSFNKKSEQLMTYISLLFLATDKKIKLYQREFFGELYIVKDDASLPVEEN